MEKLKPEEIAGYIDHTILKPEATVEEVKQVCSEAKEYGFASVCVNSGCAKLVATELAGSGVSPCVTVGFPLGTCAPEAKAFETKKAVADGATEVDMVLNVGAVKSGDWALVERDVKDVVDAAGDGALVKVILETCLLTDEEKIKACDICKKAGAKFVKTSTGFNKDGATVADIRLMRREVGPGFGVKASGGVKTYEDAVAMIEAGANRLGTSSGVAIVSGGEGATGSY